MGNMGRIKVQRVYTGKIDMMGNPSFYDTSPGQPGWDDSKPFKWVELHDYDYDFDEASAIDSMYTGWAIRNP
jgi:hypothetical protein